MRALGVLLLVVLLAGCSLPGAPQKAPPVEDLGPPTAPEGDPSLPPLPPPPPAPRIPARAEVVDRWVRPDENVTAHAVAEDATTFEWYLADRNPLRERPDVALAVPPGESRSMTLAPAGRYVLDVDGRVVNVSVVPGEPGLGALVIATANATGPDESIASPGSLLTVRNDGPSPVVARLLERMPLAAVGARVSFPMPRDLDLGDYDLVLVARAGPSLGVDAARLVYDKRKPDVAWEAGPWRGRVQAASASEPEAFPWMASYAARNVTITLSGSSDLGAPFQIRARLLDAQGNELGSGAPPGFTVPSAPKGQNVVEVRVSEGALVTYEVAMRGEWILVTPASFFST